MTALTNNAKAIIVKLASFNSVSPFCTDRDNSRKKQLKLSMPSLLRKKLLLSMPSVPPEGLSQNSTKSLVSGKNLFLNLKKKNVRSSAGSGKPRLKL